MLKENPEALKKTKKEYLSRIIYRLKINCNSQQENLENEAAWLKETLIKTLDKHVKLIRITAYFKRWWNSEVQEAKYHYAKAKKAYKLYGNKKKEKRAKNNFYITLRKAKKICWQKFLQETIKDEFTDSQKRC
jgi:hypothetical protein